jgi:hypothetical protein
VPSVQYGAGAYRRTEGNFPELKLINMYLEAAKTSEQGVALLSRPGLGLLATNGSGPINGMFCKAGTLNGDVFSISGTTLYRGTTSLGSVSAAGSGVASWAGGYGELLFTRGSTLKRYNGSALSSPVFPDSASVRAVCFIGSLFVAVRADTSAKFYWSAPLDGSTWDALSFATAEREPDSLLDIMNLGDNIWLFGQQTIESWTHTGEADLPFSRIEQIAFDQGIMDTGCVCAADNSLFFIGSKRIVFRIGEVPERISDSGIEERIAASTTARLFTFWMEGGHEMVAMRLDTETLLYDCSTKEWCEFQTAQGQWIVAHAAMQGKTAYFGHQTTGQLMGWSEWDDMGVELERRLSFAQQLDEPASIDVIRVWANCGQTPLLTGQGTDPMIELRLSDDAGNTWGDWQDDRLGIQGEYRCVPEWRAQGMADFPGILGEIRVTDPVPFRLSAIKVNDQGGGRSRV